MQQKQKKLTHKENEYMESHSQIDGTFSLHTLFLKNLIA